MTPGISASLSLRAQPRLLRLSPALRRSLDVLQMSCSLLEQHLAEQVSSNPLLEYSGTRKERANGALDPLEDDPPSLYDQLTAQWRCLRMEPWMLDAGEWVIGNLNENGYLCCSLSEIADRFGLDPAQADQVVQKVQSLGPSGIAARDLQECLRLQLSLLPSHCRALAEKMTGYLPDLGSGRFAAVARALSVETRDVKETFEKLRRLDPKPGRLLGRHRPQPIVPDLTVVRKKGRWEVLCEASLPQLRVNPSYNRMLTDPKLPPEARDFIMNSLSSAVGLLRSLQERERTLLRLGRLVVQMQASFLDGGDASRLRPLSMKECARRLDIHPSTVTRAVAGKYVETPSGCVALRRFFTGRQPAVEQLIRKILSGQKGRMSDARLTELLHQAGHNLARRTVAAYRKKAKTIE